MERKFYLKNGEEVKLGDLIIKTDVTDKVVLIEKVLLTEQSIDSLLKLGIITCDEENNYPPAFIGYYIEKLADKRNWSAEKMSGYLDKLHEINPAAAFGVVLKQIAIELDKRYPDHIRNSSEIYGISCLNGNVYKISKGSIISFNGFAAFRTLKDAEFAKNIVTPLIQEILGEKV